MSAKRPEYSAISPTPPERVLSVTEYEIAQFGVYLVPDAAERLAALEKVRRSEWERNVKCGDGRSGNGRYE